MFCNGSLINTCTRSGGNPDRLSTAWYCKTGVTDVGFVCDKVAVLGKLQKMQPVLLQNVTQQDNGCANI